MRTVKFAGGDAHGFQIVQQTVYWNFQVVGNDQWPSASGLDEPKTPASLPGQLKAELPDGLQYVIALKRFHRRWRLGFESLVSDKSPLTPMRYADVKAPF
jgi:hypothetical protein